MVNFGNWLCPDALKTRRQAQRARPLKSGAADIDGFQKVAGNIGDSQIAVDQAHRLDPVQGAGDAVRRDLLFSRSQLGRVKRRIIFRGEKQIVETLGGYLHIPAEERAERGAASSQGNEKHAECAADELTDLIIGEDSIDALPDNGNEVGGVGDPRTEDGFALHLVGDSRLLHAIETELAIGVASQSDGLRERIRKELLNLHQSAAIITAKAFFEMAATCPSRRVSASSGSLLPSSPVRTASAESLSSPPVMRARSSSTPTVVMALMIVIPPLDSSMSLRK
jgi:hypothetical protein